MATETAEKRARKKRRLIVKLPLIKHREERMLDKVKRPVIDVAALTPPPEEEEEDGLPMSCQFWYEPAKEIRTIININVVGFSFVFVKGVASAGTKLVAWCTVPARVKPLTSFKPTVLEHFTKAMESDEKGHKPNSSTVICKQHEEYQLNSMSGWHPFMWNCISASKVTTLKSSNTVNATNGKDLKSELSDVTIHYHPFPVCMEGLCPRALHKLHALVEEHKDVSHFLEPSCLQELPQELTGELILFAYFPNLCDFIKSFYSLGYFNSNPSTFPIDENYGQKYLLNYDANKAALYSKVNHAHSFDSLMFLDFNTVDLSSHFVLYINYSSKQISEAIEQMHRTSFPKVATKSLAPIFNLFQEESPQAPPVADTVHSNLSAKTVDLNPWSIARKTRMANLKSPFKSFSRAKHPLRSLSKMKYPLKSPSKIKAEKQEGILTPSVPPERKESNKYFLISPKGSLLVACPLCENTKRCSRSQFYLHAKTVHKKALAEIRCPICTSEKVEPPYVTKELPQYFAHVLLNHAHKDN